MAFDTFNKGTSTYFNNFAASKEQALLESLIIESIKIYGIHVYYLPRNIVSNDPLYTEDDQSDYSNAYNIEMYIKSIDGFEGDGVFLGKLGLEIRDQVTLTVAKRIFNEEIGNNRQQKRPNEGDVIYLPLNNKVFQVKYVNYKPFFYQLGALQTYDLVCETFEYSGETFNTGFDFIDRIQYENDTNILNYVLVDEHDNQLVDEEGNIIVNEQYNMIEDMPIEDSDFFQDTVQTGTETDQQVTGANNVSGNNNIIDWSYLDPFSEGKY